MMKQPDLGNKIALLRKQKGMTQAELASKCKITLRTIQRIEAGEGIPRFFTMKRLMEILDTDLMNSNSENLNTINMDSTYVVPMFSGKTKIVLLIAMVCGIINLFFAFAEGMLLPYRLANFSDVSGITFILVYSLSFVTYSIYLYGLLQIGRKNQNIVLVACCIALIGAMVVMKSYDIASGVNPANNSIMMNSLYNIIFGILFIMLGISFFLLKKYGIVSIIAGVLECLLGLFFILSIPVPLLIFFMIIGCRSVELIIFYRAYASLQPSPLDAV
jgi:DNA-binding XRE family transcriptional regulator